LAFHIGGFLSSVGYRFLLVVFGCSCSGDYELDEEHAVPQKRAAQRICCERRFRLRGV